MSSVKLKFVDQEAIITPSFTFNAVIADLRCGPLATNHHSLNAHIEWIEYAARHHRHVQVTIDDEKQKRMINRDLYGLRLGPGVAWPEGSSYCTFVLASSSMMLSASAVAAAGEANTSIAIATMRCASMRRGVLQQKQQQQKMQMQMQMPMQWPLTLQLIDGMRTNVDVNGLLNVSHIDAFLISHGSEIGAIWLEYITAATRMGMEN